jgi:hypothetical protein
LDTKFTPQIKSEVHLVMDFLSPPGSFAATVAAGQKTTYLPLEHSFSDSEHYDLVGSFDRLNLQFNFDSVQVVVGRQAIGWGVTYFWPVMDLFSSFAPQRIDRDYKGGVDAVRATIPIGSYSEIQVVGAVLGPSVSEDGTVAVQTRFYLGRLDVGFMAGTFHQDTVLGTFLTADVSGTACRGEFTWTDSGDPADALINRERFVRATVGIDRQLTPEVGVTLEASYNGFGADDPSEYPLLAETNRVQRGDVTALGKYYGGGAVNWQIHPLWIMSQAILVNWQDPSAFWIPSVQWSTSDNTSLLFAAQAGFGGSFNQNLTPKSEYGPVPTTVFAAFKWYF